MLVMQNIKLFSLFAALRVVETFEERYVEYFYAHM